MSKKRMRVRQDSAIPETLWRRGGFFEETTITLRGGDCRDIMRQMAARGEKVHAIVTDPPYELGFVGKKWDSTGIAFDPATWKCCLDVLHPGGHLVAFGGTRTFHRIAVAIEDAGFEIRDELLELFSQDELGAACIESLDPDQRRMLFRILGQSGFGGLMAWMYGKGFPKSRDVSKAIDQEKGAKRGRVHYDSTAAGSRMQRDTEWDRPDEITGEDDVPVTAEAAQWHGWGTALKPAWEPIILARKPLDGNVADNVLRYGAGGINVVGCEIGVGASGRGRWPANVVHDGSDEVEDAFAAFGVRQGVPADAKFKRKNPDAVSILGKDSRPNNHPMKGMGDTGTAARFFFSAKAGEADRADSDHPTVKPIALMRWLVRLVSPHGGVVLDPFGGSGTTGAAALIEGMSAILLEREEEYQRDIARRMDARFVRAGK